MRERITERLREIERDQNVRILLAVESGSRAWGFASPDSDYDVRFIYVRPQKDYLKLEKMRDVIELAITDELDVNGWDLQKALRLLHNSNPTLFEWFASPVVYMQTEAAERLRAVMPEYFSVKKSLYHYVSMAEKNYREYLRGELVRAKKYLYVLRPLLAGRWILGRGTPPPVPFWELAEAELPERLREEVGRLLELKMSTPEMGEIKRMGRINEYLEQSIAEIKAEAAALPGEKGADWAALNGIFLNELERDGG